MMARLASRRPLPPATSRLARHFTEREVIAKYFLMHVTACTCPWMQESFGTFCMLSLATPSFQLEQNVLHPVCLVCRKLTVQVSFSKKLTASPACVKRPT